jgi:hypothetical protein
LVWWWFCFLWYNCPSKVSFQPYHLYLPSNRNAPRALD